MPTEAPDDKPPESVENGAQAQETSASKSHAPLERSRFGGTERRHDRSDEEVRPVSRSDLSKGPQELLEHRKARVNWGVLLISSGVILAFSVWAILTPTDARMTMQATVSWIATNLGWYYVFTIPVSACGRGWDGECQE